MKITLGLVDDHTLFVSSLPLLIQTFPGFEVIVTALNGHTLLEQLGTLPAPPDILLVDVEMEEMNGLEVVTQVARRYPLVKMVALTMKDDDVTIIGMLRAGCCAYLLKGIDGVELEKALQEVHRTGYYNADGSNIRYRRLAREAREEPGVRLTEKEKTFLRLACSDLTYRQIAGEMNLSERTIDGYRESLFEKFKVQSRVGMVLEAIRFRYVQL
jgi:DNA-binding NarL/FixJ family response regulator